MTVTRHQTRHGFPSDTPGEVWHADTWLNVTEEQAQVLRDIRIRDGVDSTSWSCAHTGMCHSHSTPQVLWRVSAYRTDAAHHLRELFGREPDESAMRAHPDPDTRHNHG